MVVYITRKVQIQGLRTERCEEYLNVRGKKRELHNEELHNIICSAIIIRVIGLKR
jgi:hypothetical protein